MAFVRVPVFEQRVDNIVGIAYAMDMLDYVQKVRFFSEYFYLRLLFLPVKSMHPSHSIQNYSVTFDFEGRAIRKFYYWRYGTQASLLCSRYFWQLHYLRHIMLFLCFPPLKNSKLSCDD